MPRSRANSEFGAPFCGRSLPPSHRRVELSRVNYRHIVRLITLAALAPLARCRQAAPAFGPNLAGARQNAEEFFYSIGSRFTNIQRPPRIIHARAQFGHNALTPSGIYNDTSIWLAVGADSATV